MLILFLLTFLLTAFIGAWMARKAGFPGWVGAIVGLVFHLPGLIVLACCDVWVECFGQSM